MQYTSRKTYLFFALIGLAVLAMTASACTPFGHNLGEISQEVNISIDEAMLTDSAPSFDVHGHDFWHDLDVDIDRMELHDGFLRFLGTKDMPDGSSAKCSIDLSLGAENGSLAAKIIAVDIPGMTVTDKPVVEVNQDLQAHIQIRDFNTDSEVLFQEVEVTEEALRMKLQVNINF